MSSSPFTIGIVQDHATPDLAANVARAETLIRAAAGRGAQIVCLQELTLLPYCAIVPDGPAAIGTGEGESAGGVQVRKLLQMALEEQLKRYELTDFTSRGALLPNNVPSTWSCNWRRRIA